MQFFKSPIGIDFKLSPPEAVIIHGLEFDPISGFVLKFDGV